MTITMNLEVEEGVCLSDFSDVLSFMGASVDISESHVVGNFELSNCYFVFRYCANPESVIAEGADVRWLVGAEGAFHCRVDAMAESWQDIKTFIMGFSRKNKLSFVLSFQYESVYAISGGGDVVFMRQMVE